MCTCKLWNEIGRQVFDPSLSGALQTAMLKHNLLCAKMLLRDSRIDPSAHDNFAIQWMSSYGQLRIVELLLQDKRVNPCATDHAAIRWAKEYGHRAVVELLLKDKRVDPWTIVDWNSEW